MAHLYNCDVHNTAFRYDGTFYYGTEEVECDKSDMWNSLYDLYNDIATNRPELLDHPFIQAFKEMKDKGFNVEYNYGM
jgi:hypothetical protein